METAARLTSCVVVCASEIVDCSSRVLMLSVVASEHFYRGRDLLLYSVASSASAGAAVAAAAFMLFFCCQCLQRFYDR